MADWYFAFSSWSSAIGSPLVNAAAGTAGRGLPSRQGQAVPRPERGFPASASHSSPHPVHYRGPPGLPRVAARRRAGRCRSVAHRVPVLPFRVDPGDAAGAILAFNHRCRRLHSPARCAAPTKGGSPVIIGCFALIQPFSPMRRQFELIRELGFDYADLTDNHDGATLGTEYGFSASFSLDSHPRTILDMVERVRPHAHQRLRPRQPARPDLAGPLRHRRDHQGDQARPLPRRETGHHHRGRPARPTSATTSPTTSASSASARNSTSRSAGPSSSASSCCWSRTASSPTPWTA